MLSPSSAAAVAYSLNYTLDLLRRFPADGVYLDDNQLGGNASDPADYSAAAVSGWREYLSARFGRDWSAQCLGYADISSPHSLFVRPQRVTCPAATARMRSR